LELTNYQNQTGQGFSDHLAENYSDLGLVLTKYKSKSNYS